MGAAPKSGIVRRSSAGHPQKLDDFSAFLRSSGSVDTAGNLSARFMAACRSDCVPADDFTAFCGSLLDFGHTYAVAFLASWKISRLKL
jgi:hypothetical protein